MGKSKTKKSMAVYELLENQMTFLAALFGALAIICTLLAFNYNKKKGIASSREVSWTDDHKDEAAVRFQFRTLNRDLGFLYTIVHVTKKTNQGDSSYGSFAMLAKESELYFKEGVYRAEIETREFQNKIVDFGISSDDIQKRKWFDVYLEKKLDTKSEEAQ